jgi:hypothetical protein
MKAKKVISYGLSSILVCYLGAMFNWKILSEMKREGIIFGANSLLSFVLSACILFVWAGIIIFVVWLWWGNE